MNKNEKFLKRIEYSNSESFAETFNEHLRENKIVHLVNIPKGINLKGFYSELVDMLGEIVNVDEDVQTGQAINERWTDIRYDSKLSTYFRHSNTRQPLHTDGAYTSYQLDVNFFFCLEKAEIGGATTFIDSTDLVYILKKYEPELYAKLQSTKVYFGKGDDQRKQRKIISKDDRGVRLNWNYFRVSPENSEEIILMSEQFHDFLEKKVVEGGLLTPVYLNVGECVFFQDDRTLHGRNSFLGERNLVKGGFNFIN